MIRPRAEWVVDLRIAFDDLDAIALDMLRPPRDRDLGPMLHASMYTEAADRIRELLAEAELPDDDPPARAASGS